MQLTSLKRLHVSSTQNVLGNELGKLVEELVGSAKNQHVVLKDTNSKQYQLILLYGSNVSHKSLAASVGDRLKMEVHTIPLSKVVSKYIGETEKNLQDLFAHAEQKNWILFFDEADALFGKRTDVKDSHDRYANIEVSYLLQQFQQFKGILILSSSADNIDDKWRKYFKSVIHLPKEK